MRVAKWHFPDDRLYDEHHQWALLRGATVRVGITDFGQDTRGDILYLQLPAPEARAAAGAAVATIETGKWVGRVYAPFGGTVTAVNREAETRPGWINEDPYGRGWLFEIETTPADGRVPLMKGEAFRAWIEAEARRYLLEDPVPGVDGGGEGQGPGA